MHNYKAFKDSCWKYASPPCEKPHLCVLHYPAVGRATKRRHKLNPNPGLHAWRGERTWPVTFCGLELHENVDIRTLSNEEKLKNLSTPRPRRMTAPSTDPAYVAYYQRGWDAREVLIATGEPTCLRCKK